MFNSEVLVAAAWSCEWRGPCGMGAQHEGGLEVVAVPTERAGVQSGGMGARYLLAPHYALLMNQVLFTTSIR